MQDRFLRACRREPVDRTPVWFMRQAGRYMAEYRAVRERHDLLEICRTPELAVEVTLQPVRALGVDAAILFSDLLLPLAPLGVPFHFAAGEGPVIDAPVR
ncbi:MAG TPA: uroporphyrinogen decarboxylase family protein, partial [Vicinamibacteria bacterium]|nr:uroporphyrinogen decarboxylase family protein [Vicinamibacteria bacterium]